MLVLLGIVIIIIGFVLKYDTIAVVLVAGVVTGLLAGIEFFVILDTLGKAFVETRYITIFILTLPAIGLSERFGLRDKAVDFIGKFTGSAIPGARHITNVLKTTLKRLNRSMRTGLNGNMDSTGLMSSR